MPDAVILFRPKAEYLMSTEGKIYSCFIEIERSYARPKKI